MIEQILYSYLKTVLAEPIYLEIPKTKPSSFYIIEKTGSGMENHIKNATLAIQSYSDTLYNAAVMNENVKEAMLSGAIGLVEISRISLNSDYNYTDGTTKQYRYQAVFDVTHY